MLWDVPLLTPVSAGSALWKQALILDLQNNTFSYKFEVKVSSTEELELGSALSLPRGTAPSQPIWAERFGAPGARWSGKVDEFVPRAQRVNLRTVMQRSHCGAFGTYKTVRTNFWPWLSNETSSLGGAYTESSPPGVVRSRSE